MFKLVAIDIDGTLIDDDFEVSKRTINKIRALRNKGINITLATGRTYSSAKQYADLLNIDDPIICYNGALIKDNSNGNIIYDARLPLDISKRIIEFGEKEKLNIKVYTDDILYVEEDDERTREICRNHKIGYEVIGRLSENIGKGAQMIILIEDEERIGEIRKKIDSINIKNISYTMSTPRSLEFGAPGVNKGNALKVLAEKYGIESKEILTIGNSLNDLGMFKYADTGIAMKNSDRILLEEWDKISKYDNNEEGVFHILDKYFD
ncbi:MAG: HAD family hydrolase [Clostridiaceae bacterium]|nr:HAD family hydrolase [Clostridiaceae bacterium]MBW4859172.1 HAD family hydrolase [Clostridiaceae bacterium]MBW4868668.1 HAD family hydrolase [Clostridiaceae bacterium]